MQFCIAKKKQREIQKRGNLLRVFRCRKEFNMTSTSLRLPALWLTFASSSVPPVPLASCMSGPLTSLTLC